MTLLSNVVVRRTILDLLFEQHGAAWKFGASCREATLMLEGYVVSLRPPPPPSNDQLRLGLLTRAHSTTGTRLALWGRADGSITVRCHDLARMPQSRATSKVPWVRLSLSAQSEVGLVQPLTWSKCEICARCVSRSSVRSTKSRP